MTTYYGTNTPESTAELQVDSTTGGALLPRMTTTQRDAITSPATGLEIYNTTTNKKNVYNGTAWVAIEATAAASFTDNALIRADGTDGALQDSNVLIDDNDNVTVPGNLTVSEASSAGVIQATVTNTSDTANSDAELEILAGGLSGGDARLQIGITSGTSWYVIADNSATDNLLIGNNADGTTPALTIDSATNDITVHNDLTVSTNLTVTGDVTVGTDAFLVDSVNDAFVVGSTTFDGEGRIVNLGGNTALVIASYTTTAAQRARLLFKKSAQATEGLTTTVINGWLGSIEWAGVDGSSAERFPLQMIAIQASTASAGYIEADLTLRQSTGSATLSQTHRWLHEGYYAQYVPGSAVADARLNANTCAFWLDEAGNTLTVKVKYSGGTVKSGTIALA